MRGNNIKRQKKKKNTENLAEGEQILHKRQTRELENLVVFVGEVEIFGQGPQKWKSTRAEQFAKII